MSKWINSGLPAGALTSTSRSLITFEKFALLLVCALNPNCKLASPFSSSVDRAARMLIRIVPASGRNRSNPTFHSLLRGNSM